MTLIVRSALLASCLLLGAGAAPAAPRWRALENVPGHEPVGVRVEGKGRAYFRLDRTAPLEVTLAGPARLKVVTRAQLPRGSEGTVSYRVWIAEGTKAVREQSTESAPASKAKVAGGSAVVCKSRTFTWEVPAGTHRVRLFGEVATAARGAGGHGAAAPVAVLARLLVAGGPRQEPPMVSLTPVEAFRSVTLAEGEKLIPYYSVAPGKPVRLRVVGPTELELTTRLDFDSTMRGEQTYRMQIWEEGRRLRQFDFHTTKASTASYTDLRDRIASKRSRVTLSVGEGTHELLVQLAQPKHGSAEIHARIPQPTVGDEE